MIRTNGSARKGNNVAYTDINFKSKKALKEAVKAGERVTVWQPGPFPLTPYSGNKVALEGPHYPEPHRWYATATIDSDNVIVEVK